MSALATISRNDPVGSAGADTAGRPMGKLVAVPEQRILTVSFRSPDGRSWDAIGGGATVAEAIRWARESCPGDTAWTAVEWSELYGD